MSPRKPLIDHVSERTESGLQDTCPHRFMPLHDPSPRRQVGPISCFSGDKIWIIMWLCYIRLQGLPCSFSLDGFEEVNHHAEEVHRTRSCRKLLATKWSPQYTTTRKWILPSTHMNLKADSSPIKPPHKTPKLNCPWLQHCREPT